MFSLLALALAGCAPVDSVTILHTNDWHSHLQGQAPNAEYTPGTTGDDATRGGAARVAAEVAALREVATDPVLVFDAGDWMDGTLFQLLRTDQAAELQVLDAIGYDAVTIGNHEFDWGPAELGRIIDTADSLGLDVPIVASNIVPSPDDPADDPLEAHFESGRIETLKVIETEEGLRVGVFGLLGDGAQALTPAATPTTFVPALEAAEQAVADLRAQDVDIVIAVTHAGLKEDLRMAGEIDGIDVIVGGHDHEPLTEVYHAGQTAIVQAGSYSLYLGELHVQRIGSHWTTVAYTLHDIDDAIAGDTDLAGKVDGFVERLDEAHLGPFGGHYYDPVAHIPGDVGISECEESGLGDLITDAFRAQVTARSAVPIDAAFEAQGVIRDPFLEGETGEQSLADLFRVLPLGLGFDGSEGYPLVDFWVTGAELTTACEVTASISPGFGCNFFIEVSGLQCSFDMSKPQLQRTIATRILRGDEYVDVDPEAVYHVAVDSYAGELMSLLGELSSGALEITPKHADGTPAADMKSLVFDADPDTAGVQEYKLWQALRDHLATFDDTDHDGVPDVPARYTEDDRRILGYER